MTEVFQPGCFATLIGSLPLADHGQATDLILEHTPEIPLWAQLPVHKEERMMAQFSSGLPGLCKDNGLCLEEIFEAVHMEGGLVGVHVCANTDWSLVLDSSADIVSFDAYAFFDRFILYPEQIKVFIDSGKILAWGIVPTLNPDDIERETIESIWDLWMGRLKQVRSLG
jgi:hypothetical protein